jgi:hypothetical protein
VGFVGSTVSWYGENAGVDAGGVTEVDVEELEKLR